MSKKYKSDAMAAIHEMMEDLHDGGVIGKQTMRRFDDACLTPIRRRARNPKEIRAIRERARQPGHFRQLPERDEQSGQQVGAWRKAAFRGITEAVVTGREEWACHSCIAAGCAIRISLPRPRRIGVGASPGREVWLEGETEGEQIDHARRFSDFSGETMGAVLLSQGKRGRNGPDDASSTLIKTGGVA